jgi:hypothetical protein
MDGHKCPLLCHFPLVLSSIQPSSLDLPINLISRINKMEALVDTIRMMTGVETLELHIFRFMAATVINYTMVHEARDIVMAMLASFGAQN